jgi:hypothetical protein
VINFFEFIAEEVREHLAALGFRTLAEAIGHVEVLDTRRPSSTGRPTASISADLAQAELPEGTCCTTYGSRSRHSRCAGPGVDQICRRRSRPVRPFALRCDPQRRPYRRNDLGPRGHQGHQGRGSARRHHRHHLRRLGGSELRRVPARRHHTAAGGRQQRLPGQGLSGGRIVAAAGSTAPSSRRRTSSPAM